MSAPDSDNTNSDFVHVSEALLLLCEELKERWENIGISTGFKKLDDLIGNLRPEMFFVIASHPGMEKTLLALTLAQNVVFTGKQVGFVVPHSNKIELTGRIVAATSGIELSKMFKGTLSEDDMAHLNGALEKTSLFNLYINAGKQVTVNSIYAECQEIKDLSLLIIEDIEHIQENNIYRKLKSLAQELKIPIIGFSSSLNINNADRPTLKNLSDEYAEQYADVIALLHVDRRRNSSRADGMDLMLVKNRYGSSDTIYLKRIKHLPKSEVAIRETKRIKVIAVGDAGIKVLNTMHKTSGVEYALVNAWIDDSDIRKLLKDSEIVIILAGMGGKTGTKIAPLIAEIAKELHIFVIAIISTPLIWEDAERSLCAAQGVIQMERSANFCLPLSLKKVAKHLVFKGVSVPDTYEHIDQNLARCAAAFVTGLMYGRYENIYQITQNIAMQFKDMIEDSEQEKIINKILNSTQKLNTNW